MKIFFFLIPFFSLCSSEALYLTYPEDPDRSIAIHWLEEQHKESSSCVFYRMKKDTEWKQVSVTDKEILEEYTLNRLVLRDLTQDTEYVFRLEKEEEERLFRTLPKTLTRSISIAIGGDAYEEMAPYQKMNREVAKRAPDFVIMAGDIAYANPGNQMKRWFAFFKEWQKMMKDQEGRLIPIVATIGNHDLSAKKNYFPAFFPYLQQGSYGILQVAKEASFFLLDTGHMAPIEGKQTDWLKQELIKDRMNYKFCVYHVAAYPSVYPYKGKKPKAIREHWCPLFEEYKILVSFENHNHAFKKTYPLRAGKIDPTGVIYLGDGSWSAHPRKPSKEWYLETAQKKNAYSLLSISPEKAHIKMIDIDGEILGELDLKTQKK